MVHGGEGSTSWTRLNWGRGPPPPDAASRLLFPAAAPLLKPTKAPVLGSGKDTGFPSSLCSRRAPGSAGALWAWPTWDLCQGTALGWEARDQPPQIGEKEPRKERQARRRGPVPRAPRREDLPTGPGPARAELTSARHSPPDTPRRVEPGLPTVLGSGLRPHEASHVPCPAGSGCHAVAPRERVPGPHASRGHVPPLMTGHSALCSLPAPLAGGGV